MMPERSEKRPANAQKMSGVASRKVASRVSRIWNANSLTPGPSRGRCATRDAINRARGGFSMYANAPENRMMSPWMTSSMSRVMVWNSRSSSLPPWYRAPKSRLASTIPIGWLRPISDTAMPVNP